MTEATVVFAMGIFILIPFSLARETCVRTPSTVFPSARSKSLDLTEKRVHESDEECGVFRLSSMHPSPMSYSSTSTLSDSVMNLRIVPALELPSHPRQVNCWFHTTHQTFLTTRQFKFAQQSPPSSQIHFECACTAQLGPEAKRLFRNRILRRSGSTSGYLSQDVPDLALFHSSNVVDTRSLLFTVSTFHCERLVTESERHPRRSSGSFTRNSKIPLTPSHHPRHHPRMTDVHELVPSHITYMRSFFLEQGRNRQPGKETSRTHDNFLG